MTRLSLPSLAIAGLLSLLFDRSTGNHAVCHWKEGPLSPFYYSYRRFCIADVARSLSGEASYWCGRDWAVRTAGIAGIEGRGRQALTFPSPPYLRTTTGS